MYPKAQNIDQVSCLESLVGIRSQCSPEEKPAFFIEDLEGVDTKKLSSLARASSFKGVDFGRFLIGSAAREMLGDIELLMNNGNSLKTILGAACSKCDLRPVYTANTGILIKPATPSSYATIQISSLTILANVSGPQQFCIDDGFTPKFFTPNLTAGVKIPVNIDYMTTIQQPGQAIKIFFTDPSISLGQVFCPANSSCGCGGKTGENLPFIISGLSGGNETTTQYGFLPCITVGCSVDALVCSMIRQTPKIFGLALLYKVGEKLTVEKGQSVRNNEEASFQEVPEVQRQFGQLYWAKMKGAAGNMKGIRHIINDFLANRRADFCVDCKAKVYSSYVSG